MNQFNMADMFGRINDLQNKVKEAQDRLGEVIVEAEAGGGMVRVKANGKRQVISIDVDRDVIDPDDKEILEDLDCSRGKQSPRKSRGSCQRKNAGSVQRHYARRRPARHGPE
jgi:nucleoid-associated protein EbfC